MPHNDRTDLIQLFNVKVQQGDESAFDAIYSSQAIERHEPCQLHMFSPWSCSAGSSRRDMADQTQQHQQHKLVSEVQDGKRQLQPCRGL